MDILGPAPKTLFVRIIDVSQNGVRVRGVEDVRAGTAVALNSGQSMLLGEIVWCEMGDAGIVLEQLLDIAWIEKLRSLE